nr:DUF6710 family protein [Cupriavidus sp. IDO]
MLDVAELGRDPYPSIDVDKFFSPIVSHRLYLPDGSTWRGKEVETDRIRLGLARDIVLLCAWNMQRYVGALACIGKEKFDDRDTTWRQDYNHGVTLWLPWGIGFVTGGNHSITAGILAGEGEKQGSQGSCPPGCPGLRPAREDLWVRESESRELRRLDVVLADWGGSAGCPGAVGSRLS